MPQFSRAHTFVDGQVLTDDQLNSNWDEIEDLLNNVGLDASNLQSAIIGTPELQNGAATGEKLGTQTAFILRRAASQNAPTGGDTNISWDTEDYDSANLITVPDSSLALPVGLWLVFAQAALLGATQLADADAGIRILQDGTEIASDVQTYEPSTTIVGGRPVSTLLRVASGTDELVVAARQFTGQNLTITSARLSALKVGT